MPFTGICNPEQLAVLSKVLDNHCTKYGIDKPSPDHEDAAYLIMLAFIRGAQTVEELEAALDVTMAADVRRQA